MLNIGGRTIELFPSRAPGAPLVVFNTFEGEGAPVCEAVRAVTREDFTLAAVSGLKWDDDMTPWPIPPIAKGADPCGGKADEWLEELTGAVMPAVRAELAGEPVYTALAGYSLGGLFAVYALYRTDVFASGSMWYPGFLEYVRTHEPLRRPDFVSLSLGDREANTRNPVMKPVEENTRQLETWFRDMGVATAFELNPGGHFRDADARMGRAIARMLEGRTTV